MHIGMNIDWEFELEIAHGIADSKAVSEIVELKDGGKLHRFAYQNAAGEDINYVIPASLYGEGFARMVIDGLPIELTLLIDNRVEICWPVGEHAHARR